MVYWVAEAVATLLAFTTITPAILLIGLLLFKRNEIQKVPPPLASLPCVSIIVPAYNEEKTIANTVLSSLALNYPKEKLEIVVVNDGSKDRTKDICEVFEKRGEIILVNQKNAGKGAAMNAGVRAANGEFVVCLDADSEPHPDALMKMLCHFTSDDVACVTAAMKVKNKKEFLSGTQAIEYVFSIILRKLLSFVNAIVVIPGPFSIYKKSILQKVGGFDEYNLTEDNEIALRFLDRGYRIHNCIDGYVHTLAPTTLSSLYKQRLRWNRGNIENCIKYKHLFFNPRNPYVGFLILPMFVASFGAVFTTIAFFSYNFIRNLANATDYLWRLYMINFDIRPFLSALTLASTKEQVMYYFLSMTMMNVVYVTLSGLLIFILYAAFKHSREKISGYNKFSLPAYLLIYFPMLSLAWCAAIMHHIFGVKRQWNHKADA